MLSTKIERLRGLTWSQVRNLYQFAVRRVNEEHLPQVAGSLTFATVLALVPVVTIAFAIFTAFPIFNTFRTSLEAYFIQNLMPKAIADTILYYLNLFASKSKGVSAIGSVMLIVTAITTMRMIERVFNQIWRVKTKRPLSRSVLVYWATVTLGPLLIGMSITLTSNLFKATHGVVMPISLVSAVFSTCASILLTTGAYTLLYVVIPNRLVDWRDAAWGGLLAAVAFEIAKRLFAVYITKFPTYTMVYGAIAAIPIFLVWIYLFWMITLVGAVLAAALPVVKYERWWKVESPGSAFIDAMAVLHVLYDARTAGSTAEVNVTKIRAKTRLGFEETEKLLQKMLDAGWVGCYKPEVPLHAQWGKHITEGLDRWALLANPEQLKLADVYRLFVFNASNNNALARQVETAIEQGLNQTLAEHFYQH
jgi:membrane protein